MASSTPLVLASLLLLFLLAIHLVEPRSVLDSEKMTSGVEEKSLLTDEKTVDAGLSCGGACMVRCSQSSRPNLCKRACGTCCSRCSCVPPGTYGNYDVCPCYAALTTRGGQRKCP